MIIAPPIGYKITDRPDLQPVLLREGDKIIHSRHCAVIFHDFADDTGGIQSRQPRHIHCRLGMPRAHEHATIASDQGRSEEHTSELQSLMRISYAVFCLKKKKLKALK